MRASFSGVVGIFPVDFVIAFFSITVVIRMSPFKYKNITSNIKSEMIHTISITQNKRMFYNYLIKIEYLFADADGVAVNSNC